MIIKDINGGTLELSKTKLTEITGYIAEPYFVLLKDLKNEEFHVSPVRDPRFKLHCLFEEKGPNTIGCRKFSRATFAKILRAAGVRKTKRKPAKKGKK